MGKYDKDAYQQTRYNRTKYNGTTALGAQRTRWVEVGDRSLGCLASIGGGSAKRSVIGWKNQEERYLYAKFPSYPELNYLEMEIALRDFLELERAAPQLVWHRTDTPEGVRLGVRIKIWRMAQHALWDRRAEQQRQTR